VPGVGPGAQPVAHALLQAREDVDRILTGTARDQLWTAPGDAASAGFHLLHLAGSLDRLFTYALGEGLSPEQRHDLAREKEGSHRPGPDELRDHLIGTIDAAMDQLRVTPDELLDQPRPVGRARLPSTVRGLLFHAAEHTTRHVGQAITTLRIVRSV
jgi:uncharacterized damage-inducible protein DinB